VVPPSTPPRVRTNAASATGSAPSPPRARRASSAAAVPGYLPPDWAPRRPLHDGVVLV